MKPVKGDVVVQKVKSLLGVHSTQGIQFDSLSENTPGQAADEARGAWSLPQNGRPRVTGFWLQPEPLLAIKSILGKHWMEYVSSAQSPFLHSALLSSVSPAFKILRKQAIK